MEETQRKKRTAFLFDILRGFAIGVGFILPGFSGGSTATILGIYEKMIGAIANIFKDFKKSFLTILPIGLGMILGIGSLIFPLTIALNNFPFPTVSIFAGLTIGGLPSVTDKLGGKPKPAHCFAFLVPLLLTFSLALLPIGNDINLFELTFGGYILLFVIGIVASAALVVPGISGSMLLLIIGYYNPILKMLTEHLLVGKDVGVSLAVICTIGVGIIVGFLLISMIMNVLFKKCPRGTYFAAVGFIVGSIPTIFVSTAKDAGLDWSTLPTSVLHWVICALMLILGFVLAYTLVIYSRKVIKQNKNEE